MRALIRNGVLCAWKGPSLLVVTTGWRRWRVGPTHRFLLSRGTVPEHAAPRNRRPSAVAVRGCRDRSRSPAIRLHVSGSRGVRRGRQRPGGRRGASQPERASPARHRHHGHLSHLPRTSVGHRRRRQSHEGAAVDRALLDSRGRLRRHSGGAGRHARAAGSDRCPAGGQRDPLHLPAPAAALRGRDFPDRRRLAADLARGGDRSHTESRERPRPSASRPVRTASWISPMRTIATLFSGNGGTASRGFERRETGWPNGRLPAASATSRRFLSPRASRTNG